MFTIIFFVAGTAHSPKLSKYLIENQKKRGEFQYDRKGKALYNSTYHAFFLRENRNGDMCFWFNGPCRNG